MDTQSFLGPLADRLRPTCIDDFFGQTHLLSPGKPLYESLVKGHLHSMILWGPPGTGKTTLAKIIATHTKVRFEPFSDSLAGVKEIRNIVERAQSVLHTKFPQKTLVFIDEIHRFNKIQQDTLLPYLESGLFTLIGATTENPSFELNNALLSRTRIYVLKKLIEKDLIAIINRALNHRERGLGNQGLTIAEDVKKILASMADGDARQALNLLEIAADLATNKVIDKKTLQRLTHTHLQRFDKKGDFFYAQISALHKSVRGTDPDAALYWLARMLVAGCDPLYLARRIVRMAIEDIGIADPRGLQIALQAWDVQQRLGSPEGELALAQAVVYLSCTVKSNTVYKALNAAMKDAEECGSVEVPLHLRNAPTKLMRKFDYGKNYQYPHDEVEAYVYGECYLPEQLANKQYYFPAHRGLELKIAAKLAALRKKSRKST